MRARQKRERERQAPTEREPAAGFQLCSHVWDDGSLAPEHQFFGKWVSQIASLGSVTALIPDQTLSTVPHAAELLYRGHLIPPQMCMITVCGLHSGLWLIWWYLHLMKQPKAQVMGKWWTNSTEKHFGDVGGQAYHSILCQRTYSDSLSLHTKYAHVDKPRALSYWGWVMAM